MLGSDRGRRRSKNFNPARCKRAKKGDRMLAIGYVRRSANPDDRTVSIQTQKDNIEAYCRQHGMTVAEFVEHDGISGTKLSRFSELSEAIAKFKPAAIVYYIQDRIARNVGLANFLKPLQKKGIEIHESAGIGRIGAGAVDRMVINMRASADQAFAELTGEKTRDALAKLKTSGRRYSNIPPLGFCHVPAGRDAEGREIFALKPDPEEQKAIEILRLCKAQGMGPRRALRVLSTANYNGRLSKGAVERALRDL